MNELLEACVQGDRLAQKRLYDHFKGKMYALCLRYANSREEAQDLLQEGFINVFRDLHQFKELGSLEGWIRRVILHTALRHIKRQKNLITGDDLDAKAHMLVAEEDEPPNEEMIKKLLYFMHQMPTGFRTVLNLYVLEGFTHAEIATELGISVGTSKSQLNRAKKYLKDMLEKSLMG